MNIITKTELSLISKYEKLLKINIAPKYMANGKILDQVKTVDQTKVQHKARPMNKFKPAKTKTDKKE